MALVDPKLDYVDNGGSVRYIDGSRLARSMSLPASQRLIAVGFLAVALLIGGTMGYKVIDKVIGEPARAAAVVQENLSRSVSLDLPVVSELIEDDDASILAAFTEAGYSLYDITDEEVAEEGTGIDIMKFPSDMDAEEAKALYDTGLTNIDASDAAMLLNGSWEFITDRATGTDLRVKYCDFSSGSIDAAIDNAIINQGLDSTTFDESGTDTSGNTYQSGTIEIDGYTYNWLISACTLTDVYDIDNIDDTAVYVGVRIYS